MARIRTVKPDFFRHFGLYTAERESGLPLRLSFEGLWTAADREGRFIWLPESLKLDCLPFDPVDFRVVMETLARYGFIKKYTHGGKTFGCIPSWNEHQIVNAREAQSKLPSIDDADHVHSYDDACLTRASRVPHACLTRQDSYTGEQERELEGEEEQVLEAKASSPAKAGREDVPNEADKPKWWPKRDRYGRVVSDVTDKLIYDVGKAVLGRNSGGLITKLKKCYRQDLRAVADILMQADEKADPPDWFAGVLRRAELDELQTLNHEKYPENVYRER